MAQSAHLAILQKGVQVWNRWRKELAAETPDLAQVNLAKAQLNNVDFRSVNLSGAIFDEADLREADLSATSLVSANLRSANLSLASFRGATLSGAIFTGATLTGADMSRAVLSRADFRDADLQFVRLIEADVTEALFRQCKLTGADFSGAILGHTAFSEVDLATVRGLDATTHIAPSSIGIETIFRSRGQLPAIFLRSAGVPENFITYLKSLTGNAIEFYSCFISYSAQDQSFADRLFVDLQNRGIRCWFAPHDLRAGKKFEDQVDAAVQISDKLIVILSEHSMNTEWVKSEISASRKKELNQRRQVLFPIRLVSFERLRDWELFDADTGRDSAREIREYYIPDFSNWKEDHDSYQRMFSRLVKDLTLSTATSPIAELSHEG